jgi:hypothetical protein
MRTASPEKEMLLLARCCSFLKALPQRLAAKAFEIAACTKKLAQDDPRRVTHSAKVGVALSLVSLVYYYQPLYVNFGVSAMWAVVTVVVVFEFSVGNVMLKILDKFLCFCSLVNQIQLIKQLLTCMLFRSHSWKRSE